MRTNDTGFLPALRSVRSGGLAWLLLALVCRSLAADGTDADSRLPVPADQAITQARDLVRQAFEDRYKAAADGRLGDLLDPLLEAMAKSDVPERKYAMLVEAEQAAAAAGDMPKAVEIIATRAKLFRVDGLAEAVAALDLCVTTNRKANPNLLEGVLEQALDTATDAVEADRLDEASKATNAAIAAAKAVTLASKSAKQSLKPGLGGLAADVSTRAEALNQTIRRRAQAREGTQAAAEKLVSSPDDPEANAVVGGYECFILGDWNRGLPRLAKSNVERLKQAAAAELRVQAAGRPPAQELSAWPAAGGPRRMPVARNPKPPTRSAVTPPASTPLPWTA
jgi:hypothetical protein